jgi:hypothetical protein
MNLDTELHMAYKFGNTSINTFPYPHLYIQNVFPNDFYSQILKNLPSVNSMTSLPDLYPEQPGFKGYKERYVLEFLRDEHIQKIEKDKQEFWKGVSSSFLKGQFGNLLRAKFKLYLDMRFKLIGDVNFSVEMQLINDKKNYSLGPHSDHSRKVISALLYLPKDMSQKKIGTSIYIPKDPDFISSQKEYGHFNKDLFHKVITMPFVPNSAFCFVKTNNAFHGVEPLDKETTDRWVLLFDIYISEETQLREEEAKVKFK